MRIEGTFIENGNIMFNVIDTAPPGRKTVVDTSDMKLFIEDNNGIMNASARKVTHYITIKKNKK
jgi:hypothetical protein